MTVDGGSLSPSEDKPEPHGAMLGSGDGRERPAFYEPSKATVRAWAWLRLMGFTLCVGCGGAPFTMGFADPLVADALSSSEDASAPADSAGLGIGEGGEISQGADAGGGDSESTTDARDAGFEPLADAGGHPDTGLGEAGPRLCCKTPACGQLYWPVPYMSSLTGTSWGFAGAEGGACGVNGTPWGNCAGTLVVCPAGQ